MPAFLLIAVLLVTGCTRSVSPEVYRPLSEAFDRYEAAETRYFGRLVFSVSPKVFSKSNTFKALLVDQRGDEWLFKASENGASDGIVAAYRIMNLFGMDSPEAHYKTLVFNGVPVEGTVQRFVRNRGGITPTLLQKLPPGPAAYMARSHVMSWLLANHQVHNDQFLVLPAEGGPVTGLLRIDNSVNWFLLSQDRIDIDYRTPVLQDFGSVGYYKFWQAFLGGKVAVPLAEVFQWARFVSGYPDDAYLAFFAKGIEHGLDQLPNNGAGSSPSFWEIFPEIKARAPERSEVPRLLVERKRNLPRNLGRLYRQLSAWAGKPARLDDGWDPAGIAAELSDRLLRKAKQLGEADVSLAAVPAAGQKPLETRISLEALRALRLLSRIGNVPAKERVLELERIRIAVERVARNHASPIEREAARSALAHLQEFARVSRAYWEGAIPRDDYLEVSLDLPKFFAQRWPELEELVKIAESGRRSKRVVGRPAASEW